MGPVLPLYTAIVDQLEEGFVHQSRGLKGVPHTLARHIPSGNAAQFRLNKGRQPFERPIITIGPVL
jgi:hypothetical protein